MKKLILMMAFAMPLLFTSCSSDDCEASDWVGVFKGSATCDGSNLDVTMTLTQVLGIVSYNLEATDGTATETTGGTFNPDGCKVETSTLFEEEFTFELDGDNLKVSDGECTFNLKK